MTTIDTVLSFVISYVAGIVPTDWLCNHKSMKEKLELCFKRAVYKWTNNPDTQNAVGEQMGKYLPQLKDFIAHKPVGRHPRENDLLRLWAEEIQNDTECNQFFLEYEHQIMALKLEEGCITAKEILENTNNIIAQIEQLSNRGITQCVKYWEQWAWGPDIKLNTNILLAGREKEKEKVIEACNEPSCLYVEAASVKEAIAFVVASIISESDVLAERTVVAMNKEAYKDIVENSNGMVFVTDIQEDAHYIVSRSHTVILCICPSDKKNEACTIHLPMLNREGFIGSLVESGINEAKARSLATDSARDISVLRSLLEFTDEAPIWQTTENIRLIIPASLPGEWNEEWPNDKQLVKLMTEKDYDDYIEEITPLLIVDECPLIRIDKIWKIKSPFDLLKQLVDYVTSSHLKRFAEVVDWVLQDDDPDAEDKMNENEFRWWQNKQYFSGHIKEGVFQSLTLLSIVPCHIHNNANWVDNFIENKFKSFDLKRYLTHRHNLQWLVEASPSSFIKFIQDDIKNGSPLLNQIMDVKHKDFSFGGEIYYTDLLFALEALAWDEQYLFDTTDILMHLCFYPNDSNYGNKPINTLLSIYRFGLPQTYASFETRLGILKSCVKRHPKIVSALCILLLNGLSENTFMQNPHFRWRMRERIESPNCIPCIPTANVVAIGQLLLSTSEFSIEDIKEIINLSFNIYLRDCRIMFLNAINKQKDKIKGNEEITKCIREKINWHLLYQEADWALSKEEIEPFEKLLNEIESDDIIVRNKYLFESFLINESDLKDYDKDIAERDKETRETRAQIVRQIIEEKGLNAVWAFAETVKYKEGVANAIFDLYGANMYSEIYKNYCSENLSKTFVGKYFSSIYYTQDESVYMSMIDELALISQNHIAIILYAPEYRKTLANLAGELDTNIEEEYWKNVSIMSFPETEYGNVIWKLCSVGRYADVLHIIRTTNNENIISSDTKIHILCEMIKNGAWDILRKCKYEISEILKVISLPKDNPQKSLLLQMEFVMYDSLQQHMNAQEIHIVQEINKEPSLLLEIYALVFKADDGFEEKCPQDNNQTEIKMTMAQLAYSFIHNYNEVPCSDSAGNVDENALFKYFDKLEKLAKQCHRTNILPLIIGRILGNFSETGDYPSEMLCRFVEHFNDDRVDTEIRCALYNRRGMTSRSPFEGGTIERNHIQTFMKYRDKARYRSSPRLTHIFECLIKEYQQMAEKEDNEAKFLDITN